MNTEMRDTHLARYADRVASHIGWPSNAFRLTRWEAFVARVITLFDSPKAVSAVARTGAIALCLGILGCAGLGTQQASNLTAPISGEHGLDGVLMTARRSPTRGIEVLPYAGGELGLWAEPATTKIQSGPAPQEAQSGEVFWDPDYNTCNTVSVGFLAPTGAR